MGEEEKKREGRRGGGKPGWIWGLVPEHPKLLLGSAEDPDSYICGEAGVDVVRRELGCRSRSEGEQNPDLS